MGWVGGFGVRRRPRGAREGRFPLPAGEQALAGPAGLLYQSRWVPLPQGTLAEGRSLPSRPLLLGNPRAGAALERWLAEHGIALERAAVAAAADLPTASPLRAADVVLFWPDLADPAATAEGLCSTLLNLAQTIAAEPAGRELWLVLDPTEAQQQLAGGLRGWWRTAALEQPQLNWTLLDLGGSGASAPGPPDLTHPRAPAGP